MKYLYLTLFFIITIKVFAQERKRIELDNEGKLYSPDTNKIIKEFRNGIAPFMIKNKDPFNFKLNRVGFIDSTGKIIIQPKYANCSYFEGGKAIVQDTNRNFGVINESGKEILPLIYSYINRCENGLFFVKKNGKLGLISSEGKQLIAPNYYTTYSIIPQTPYEADDSPSLNIFHWYLLSTDPAVRFKGFIGVKNGNLWAVINKKGVEVVSPKFENIEVFNHNIAVATYNKKKGVIDTNGNWLINPEYDYIEIIANKRIIVTSNKKKGVLSINNQVIIPIKYDIIKSLETNDYLVEMENGHLIGLINDKDEIIIPIEKQEIIPFGSGFLVRDFPYKNNRSFPYILYIDHGKKISKYSSWGIKIAPPVLSLYKSFDSINYVVYNQFKEEFVGYKEINDTYNGNNIKSRGIFYKKNDRWGLLNNAGIQMTHPIYDEIRSVSLIYNKPPLIFAKRKEKWGLIDSTGTSLLKYEYDEYGKFSEGFAWMRKGGLYRLIVGDKPDISPLVYDKIYQDESWAYHRHNTIPVKKDDKWGFLDSKGRALTPFIYDEFINLSSNNNAGANYLTPVRIGNKWGFLDKSFKPVTDVKYDDKYFTTTSQGKGVYILTEDNKKE